MRPEVEYVAKRRQKVRQAPEQVYEYVEEEPYARPAGPSYWDSRPHQPQQ